MIEEALSGGTIYKKFCPMAFNNNDAYWYADIEEINNPYFGDKMLNCGAVKKTIKKQDTLTNQKPNKMNSEDNKQHKKSSNYLRFFLMLGLSFIAMYITMYFNTYEFNHVYFSLTRFYMTCLGISAMAVIMLSLMLKMYKNKRKNIAIYAGSLILFVSALGLVRVQSPIVGDLLYMKAMIPHHSIAILTSKRADIKDPETKKLAKEIIEAQEREIVQMKKIIYRLENEVN